MGIVRHTVAARRTVYRRARASKAVPANLQRARASLQARIHGTGFLESRTRARRSARPVRFLCNLATANCTGSRWGLSRRQPARRTSGGGGAFRRRLVTWWGRRPPLRGPACRPVSVPPGEGSPGDGGIRRGSAWRWSGSRAGCGCLALRHSAPIDNAGAEPTIHRRREDSL